MLLNKFIYIPQIIKFIIAQILLLIFFWYLSLLIYIFLVIFILHNVTIIPKGYNILFFLPYMGWVFNIIYIYKLNLKTEIKENKLLFQIVSIFFIAITILLILLKIWFSIKTHNFFVF